MTDYDVETVSRVRVYLALFDELLDGRCAVEAFEDRFNELFMAEPDDMPDPLFVVLDGVFAEAEALVLDDGPIDPDWDVLPAQLLEYVAGARAKLAGLIGDGPVDGADRDR